MLPRAKKTYKVLTNLQTQIFK